MAEPLLTTEASNTEVQAAQKTEAGSSPAKVEQQSNPQDPVVAKPDDATKQPKAADPAPAEVAPDSYSFTAPEGVTLSDEFVGSYSEVARELNLTQEKAQKLIGKVLPAYKAQVQAENEALHEQWHKQSSEDKDIGGDKLPLTIKAAHRAIAAFGSKGFGELLSTSPIGSHPEVLKFLANVARTLKEDTPVMGGSGPDAEDADAARARKLYPKSQATS